MSEATRAVLSREEIDAILASASEGAQGEEARFRPGAGATANPDFAWTPLARALRGFGEEQGRQLSTAFQRTLGFTLVDLRSLPAADFAAALVPNDSALLLRFEPNLGTGVLLVGRTLLYGWLTLAFGGHVDGSPPPVVPNRAASRIEMRFLSGIAEELCRLLGAALARLCEGRLELGPALEAELLPSQIAPRLLVASFDARGFGNVARLRVALPESLFQNERPKRGAGRPAGAVVPELAERLQAMPLRLRAEVGRAELPLGRLKGLRAGDVVPLQAASPGGVLLRVEDEAKFRGVPGVVGARAAVRITERM
jgi:flagellar motor switch protein FliM